MTTLEDNGKVAFTYQLNSDTQGGQGPILPNKMHKLVTGHQPGLAWPQTQTFDQMEVEP